MQRSFGAGWSSPVARQAHNLKVIGSNPIPATKILLLTQRCSKHRLFRPPRDSAYGACNPPSKVNEYVPD